MKTKIKVSGNIISELSEKIPTNIIALNELMKTHMMPGKICKYNLKIVKNTIDN